ncbi:MAG TPA: acyltransferase [Verrucomicrobiales bacterium]|nr:acyltransferase [Verrucomicrobiales bacterium]
MRNIRAAVVQFEHENGEKGTNLETISRFVKCASTEQVKLIVFPECCISGYWFLRNLSKEELIKLAECAKEGPSATHLRNLAQQYGMTIGAGLIEKTENDQLFNSYLVALPDGRIEVHRKIHAFVSAHIESGNEFTVFNSPEECRLGVLTCYDNNINENVRITALRGAEILLAPHQTGGCDSPDPETMGKVDPNIWDRRQADPETAMREINGPKGRAWLMRWLPSRAHDNGMFVLFSNGIGRDDDEIRTGNSMILDPYGRILNEASRPGEELVIADLDADLFIKNTGQRWIRSRRPDLYAELSCPTGKELDTRTLRFDGKGV